LSAIEVVTMLAADDARPTVYLGGGVFGASNETMRDMR